MKKTLLKEIGAFIEEHNISENAFCTLCKLNTTWLTKARQRAQSQGTDIGIHTSSLKKVRAVLDGKVPIPPELERQNVIRFNSGHDITDLIKRVAESGRTVTFAEFHALCRSDYELNRFFNPDKK